MPGEGVADAVGDPLVADLLEGLHDVGVAADDQVDVGIAVQLPGPVRLVAAKFVDELFAPMRGEHDDLGAGLAVAAAAVRMAGIPGLRGGKPNILSIAIMTAMWLIAGRGPALGLPGHVVTVNATPLAAPAAGSAATVLVE